MGISIPCSACTFFPWRPGDQKKYQFLLPGLTVQCKRPLLVPPNPGIDRESSRFCKVPGRLHFRLHWGGAKAQARPQGLRPGQARIKPALAWIPHCTVYNCIVLSWKWPNSSAGKNERMRPARFLPGWVTLSGLSTKLLSLQQIDETRATA